MFLLLASSFDKGARAMVEQLGSSWVLITPRDLSRPGWRLSVPSAGALAIATAARRIPESEIDGVYARLPFVPEQELFHIDAADRSYVAAEMQAFLFALLSSLRAPVINYPNPACLSGPNLRCGDWREIARKHIALSRSETPTETTEYVTVVGQEVVEDVDPVLGIAARAISSAAAAPFLRICFESKPRKFRFVSADYWVDCSQWKIAALIQKYLQRAQ